jgi:Ca2+-binding RTX toxin-like protein
MTRPHRTAVAAVVVACLVAAAGASGQSGAKTSHRYWPTIDGVLRKAHEGDATYTGTRRSDELLGHHGSDDIRGGDGSDVLWGDWDAVDQPTRQKDVIYGGNGTDFIYGSHGTNDIRAGNGNDVISVHYGRGRVDCGSGRDIYHVARSRRSKYRFLHCERSTTAPRARAAVRSSRCPSARLD